MSCCDRRTSYYAPDALFLETSSPSASGEGVRARSQAFVEPAKESVILRQATLGDHELIVLGTKGWSGSHGTLVTVPTPLIARTMLDTYRKIVTCEGDG
jgi:hypothetical protein